MWLEWIDKGNTVPVPFNILYHLLSLLITLMLCICGNICGCCNTCRCEEVRHELLAGTIY